MPMKRGLGLRGAMPFILILGGCFMAAVAGLARTSGTGGGATPGRLVAREDRATWTSPERPSRLLSVDEAGATFLLDNPGGSPVRIVEVVSGCGCATPKVEPRTIAPGGVATVEVKAVPLQVGEKSVPIRLRTDSPATPEVSLILQIVGARKPPYMGKVAGDLSFRADFSEAEAEVRKVEVHTIEPADLEPRAPTPTVDLPYLQVSPGRLVREDPSTTTDTLGRTYEYELRLVGRPPQRRFSGDFQVVDPWDSDHVERLRVHGDAPAPLRAAPSRLVFRAGGRPEARTNILKVLLFADAEVDWSGYSAVLEGGAGPITLGPIVPDPASSGASFDVELRPDARPGGGSRIFVRGGEPAAEVVIPVVVRSWDDAN